MRNLGYKIVLGENFRALNTYTKKEERFKVNNLSFHLKKLGLKKQMETKVSRKKQKRKIREQINEIANGQTIKKNQ